MNYSLKENVRVLVSLLKAYQIKDIVLSSGNRNVPFVHLVENDNFFTCYSIVDERSAGFFAIGLIEKLNRPVAICCTSGTAVCNYTSPVAEAYYQKLPLLVLTADRPAFFLKHNEDQMIPQLDVLSSIMKTSVDLPAIVNQQDYWYCLNQIHIALLELDHHGKGPVHINFYIEDKATNVSDALYEKPIELNRVNRFEIGKSNQIKWKNTVQELSKSRVMVLYGQANDVSEEEISLLNKFVEKFNCVIVKDHLSNLHCKKAINIYSALSILSDTELEKLLPDIIITMAGNSILFQPLKALLARYNKKTKQWLVSQDGCVHDSLRCLSDIFECTSLDFLEYFSYSEIETKNLYYEQWQTALNRIKYPDPIYSSLYAVKRLMECMPEHSVFHIGNSSSVRYANMFSMKKSIKVFCNRGTNGIDGSFSSFMGNAVASNELSFLLIGDLSFFYDLNACWNRYRGRNIRIMLNNNEGAELFHYSYGRKISGINNYIAAEHDATAKGWIESQGFKYLCAHNQDEFEKNFLEFLNEDSDKPILFEVFTQKADDAKVVHDYYEENTALNLRHETKKIVKKMMEKSKSLDVAINKARNKL